MSKRRFWAVQFYIYLRITKYTREAVKWKAQKKYRTQKYMFVSYSNEKCNQ